MKKIAILILFTSFSAFMYAQTDLSKELQNLYDQQAYDKILEEYTPKIKDLSAKSVYYIGMVHYMKEEDDKCIEMMNLSIKKDSTDADAYFIRGMTQNYLGKFTEAILSFQSAIRLDSSKSDYFSGLGDSYFNIEQYETALEAYQEATEKEYPIDRPFIMIPQILSAQEKPEEALKAFYLAKNNISKETSSYITVLYNIGLSELLHKNYNKSESAFKEIIEIYPEDYQTYAKLIQVYYGKKEYNKATPYRDILYQAYHKGVLTDNLKEMFCFDQFNWKDKLIQVFERFEEKEGELYYKHLFYVVNQNDEIELRLQTENSPISIELGGPKYLIGMNRGDTHSTFRYGFAEDFKYDELKATIIEILDKKIKPTTTLKRE